MNTKILNSIPFQVIDEHIFEKIGRKGKKKVSVRVETCIQKATDDVKKNAEAKAMYKVFSIKDKNDTIWAEGVHFDSKKLSNMLKACDKVVVFLITLGEKIDKLVHSNVKNRLHYGYILDATASLAVESAAQNFQEHIENKVTGNGKTTLRYSPGYCDWPLCEQEKIFQLLRHEQINVNLTDSYLMSPSKSISGIIGIASNDSDNFIRSTCHECKKTDCQYKR